MTLPARIPKVTKRETRWKSTAHRNWIRQFACCNCGCMVGIEVAHVRIGSGAGLGQKPDDFRTVPLCKDCHSEQHRMGERTFWARYAHLTGQTVDRLLSEFAAASPRATEIRQAQRERAA